MGRLKNRLMAALITRFPGFFNLEKYADTLEHVTVYGIPWTPIKKPLKASTVAIVTTSGVHLKSQTPFDMEDPDGDPSYRELPSDTPPGEYMITHDYYDHGDADRDLNIVFPLDRLREMVAGGEVGALAPVNYSFMGHITGPHVETLVGETAPEVARRLKEASVDVVLLTPG